VPQHTKCIGIKPIPMFRHQRQTIVIMRRRADSALQDGFGKVWGWFHHWRLNEQDGFGVMGSDCCCVGCPVSCKEIFYEIDFA
jgi:hypothetical protein